MERPAPSGILAKGGDQRNKDKDWTATRLKECKQYTGWGCRLHLVDYCLKKENADQVYRESRAAACAPAMRVSLSKLTVLPPE